MLRIGKGYDVHALVEGRKLILGGIKIPHHKGLDGHSDADVLIHAIIDALFGALALGDLGKHFPDTDPLYAGIDSRELLRHAVGLISSLGWKIVNVDSTIMAQRPKLSPYIKDMRGNIAEDLMIPLDAVSVKATTTEKLGFVGREEGIAAEAVCLLEKEKD